MACYESFWTEWRGILRADPIWSEQVAYVYFSMSAFSAGIEVLIECKTYAQAPLYFDWPDYVLMSE
jgi:hypothetical protein